MMKLKKNFYKLIELLGVAGLVLLIQGMAVTGSFYYTDNYDWCWQRDAAFSAVPENKRALEADFYNFRMLVLSPEEDMGSALVSETSTAHTDGIGRGLRRVYYNARYMMYAGVALGFLAFLFLHRRRCYQLFRIGALVSVFLPVLFLLAAFFLRRADTVNWLACVLFSKYEAVFYDDAAFTAILPRGLMLGYAFSYAGIWLLGCLASAGVYYTKRKHRSPHRF